MRFRRIAGITAALIRTRALNRVLDRQQGDEQSPQFGRRFPVGIQFEAAFSAAVQSAEPQDAEGEEHAEVSSDFVAVVTLHGPGQHRGVGLSHRRQRHERLRRNE